MSTFGRLVLFCLARARHVDDMMGALERWLDCLRALRTPEALLGDEIEVDALLRGWRELSVLTAELVHEREDNRDGSPWTEVTATIREVDAGAGTHGTVAVRIRSVDRNGDGLPSDRPLDLVLSFDRRTRVRLSDDRDRTPNGHNGNRRRHGSIDDLRARMHVEARWRTPASDRRIVVDRIEILESR